MSKYIETMFPIDETSPSSYPQKLCSYISSKFYPYQGKLLDVGCGKGNHMLAFFRLGHPVYGIDLEPINPLVKKCDIEIEKFPYPNDYFDFVFSKSVLEHVWNTDNFISEVKRVLKPNGVCVIIVPDWESQHSYYWDDPWHVKAFTRRGLQYLFEIADFKDVKCIWFRQLPFLWKHPWLVFIPKIISILPECCKWRDNEKRKPYKLIRFSKEKMLLLSAIK